MTSFGNESNKAVLEKIIREEILPRITPLTGELPAHFIESLMENCKLINVAKEQILEESRSFEDGKLFYIYKGIAHSFYYTPLNSKPFITRIWTKGDFIFDFDSFEYKEDRTESIQMLEDGEFISINYGCLKNILERFPRIASCLSWLQSDQIKHGKFHQHLLKLNVEDRLKHYLDQNRGIINRINNDYIALHLGMNRSRLSVAYKAYKQDSDHAEEL